MGTISKAIKKLKKIITDVDKIISRLDGARINIKKYNKHKKQHSLTLDEFSKEMTGMSYDELKQFNDNIFQPIILPTECVDNKGLFMWAVEQMKQGKKVRRNRWEHDGYVIMNNKGMLVHLSGAPLNMWIEIIESTDWEIYEDNKFGDYNVTGQLITSKKLKSAIAFGEDLDDLEKAIKRARELK